MDAPPLTLSFLVRPEPTRALTPPRSPFLLPLPCVFVSASASTIFFALLLLLELCIYSWLPFALSQED
jgi:hypothetical protein